MQICHAYLSYQRNEVNSFASNPAWPSYADADVDADVDVDVDVDCTDKCKVSNN